MPQPGPSPLKAVHRPTCLSQAPAMFFFNGVRDCRLAARKPLKFSNPSNPSTGLHASARPQPCFFYGVRDCRLAARKLLKPFKPLKPLKPVHRPTCLSQAPAPSKPSTGLHASARPQPCFFYGVRECRLAARKLLKPFKPLKPLKPVHRATCLSQAPAPSKPSTGLHASARPQPCFFFTAFETAVWPPANPLNPSNPSNPSTGLHASARPQPCFFLRRSRLPFGRPQTP